MRLTPLFVAVLPFRNQGCLFILPETVHSPPEI